MVRHEFEPVYDKNSEILIWKFSFREVERIGLLLWASTEPFLKVLAAIVQEKIPDSIEEKKEMLLRNHIAVYDVIWQCKITGSSDSSIKDVVPADITTIVELSKIRKIYANGKLAEKLFSKYQEKKVGIKAIGLPSTSPANAAYSLERLVEIWSEQIKQK
ncbi:MAG: DNA-deoxyinosine glycosylase [Clostridium sp.]